MTIKRAVCLLPLCAALLKDSLGELSPGDNVAAVASASGSIRNAKSRSDVSGSSHSSGSSDISDVPSGPVVMIGDMECVEGSSRSETPYGGEWATLRDHWGIKQDWLRGKHALESTDIGSGGKSNMEFLKSRDGKFIIKGMSQVDRRSLHAILPEYTEYMKANPDSLLPRFLTACKVKKGLVSKRYVVMWSWDRGRQSPASPDWKFDLKGTEEDRLVPVPDGPPAKWDPNAKTPILKDLNFDRKHGLPDRIYLDKDTRTRVLKALERDTKWLMEHRLMDYSLFLRVENMRVEDGPVASDEVWNARICSPGTTSEPTGCQKLVGKDFQKHGGYMVGVHSCGRAGLGAAAHCYTSKGATVSVYSFGLIDILQPWNQKKKIARFFKANGLLPGGKVRREIRDTVEPSYYNERFMKTMERIFVHQGEDGQEVQDDPR